MYCARQQGREHRQRPSDFNELSQGALHHMCMYIFKSQQVQNIILPEIWIPSHQITCYSDSSENC